MGSVDNRIVILVCKMAGQTTFNGNLSDLGNPGH